jgi:hypothetical protein
MFLSGNILTKQAAILKKSQKFDEVLKKLPEPIRTFLSYNKEAFLDKPELLAAIATMYGNTLGENTETQTKTQTEINQNSEENIFSVPPIQSIQSMFDEKTNEILQSLTPNTSLSTSEKKKQVINKLKQYVNKKKSQKQQQQPTNKQQQQPTNKQQQQPTNKQQQQPTNKQQQSLNSDIVFPWQNINLPILPYENLLPKTTRLW